MESTVEKRISSSFVLNAPKASRLANLIAERFKSIGDSSIIKFTFSTKNGKHFTAKSIDDVLIHDNPVKNPINNLEIEAFDKLEEPSNHCKIEYDKEDNDIKIVVESNEAKFVNELFDEIEEQVSRCLVKDKINSIKENLSVLLIITLFILVPSSFVYYAATSDYALTDKLSSDDINELAPKFGEASTNEEKINAIFLFNKRIIDNNTGNKDFLYYLQFIKNVLSSTNTYLVAIPVLIVLVLFKMLINTYIGSVFSWGDYKLFYEGKLARRKQLINVLIGSVGAGILVNILFIGLGK